MNDVNRQRLHCHGVDANEIPYSSNCLFGDKSAVPDAAVWGDSYGAELSEALGTLVAPSRRSIMQITSSGCPPTVDYPPSRPACLNHNLETLNHLTSDTRIRTVVLAAHFPSSKLPDWQSFLAGFSRSVEGLTGAGKRVFILFPVPTYEFDPPEAIALLARFRQNPSNYSSPREEFDGSSKKTEEELDRLAKNSGALPIKTDQFLCDRFFCRAYSESAGVLYFNRDHLSVSGARLILSRISPKI